MLGPGSYPFLALLCAFLLLPGAVHTLRAQTFDLEPSGELVGFERTLALTNQSAEAIAAAAQAHGQEDDITVLTLTFAHAEVLHA